MTYGIARSATSPELALYRAPGKKSKYYCAIFQPRTIYTAQINQSFSTRDGVLSLVFDNGTGTLANVKADMLMYIGSTAGARDIGVVRVRSADATHFYIDQTAGIDFQNNQYLTVVDDYRLLQRHINIVAGVPYMDGETAYTNQHALPDPTPIMGSHRVLKMTGVNVATTFAFGQSYMIDGTAISAKVTTCPTATVTNGTTFTPTVTFNSVGWHAVYLELTGANGKSFLGVRYVYVWNDDNLPPRVKVGSLAGDINNGGWAFEIEAYNNADLADIHEGALCILFSDDYYGDTQQSIGAVEGSENIEAVGWISSPESIDWNPERPSVKFTVQGAQYWMQKISGYPAGVVFFAGTPTAWTEFQNLTVAKGVWHFLHWRCTATRILDCFLSNDTKYAPEITSLATDLWSQLQEMAALTIFARPGFNAQGQLFVQTHPQLTPEAGRTWNTVLDITAHDWRETILLERVTLPEIAQLFLSGVQINNGGEGAAFFALAPGHTYNHYGAVESVDKILIDSQASIITLAGLYFNWRNNELPDIPVMLSANIRLIDIYPNQYCSLTILIADTPRGIAYSGRIIPKSITVDFDDDAGRAIRAVVFEAETFEGMAVQELIPGSGDLTYLPDFPSFPNMPVFNDILPGLGTTPLEDNGPKYVLAHDAIFAGLVFTSTFNTASPVWYQVNSGLTATQYGNINKIVVCPNGVVYAAFLDENNNDVFIARAPTIGGTFVIVEDATSIKAKYPPGATASVYAINCNPAYSETVAYVIGNRASSIADVYYGSGGVFAAGANLTNVEHPGSISYGLGIWLFTYAGAHAGPVGFYRRLTSDCSAVIDTTESGHYRWVYHVRLGVTGYTYHYYDEAGQTLKKGTNNLETDEDIGSEIYAQDFEDLIALDPTGMFIMTSYSSTRKGKSSDGGAAWSDLGGLAYVGNIWRFAYAGGTGTASRWVAGSSYMQYSPDFGVTWETRQGNLNVISPLYQIDIVKVIGFGT